MKYPVITLWLILFISIMAPAQELVPLYPKSTKTTSQIDKQGPGTCWPMDPYYPIQHVDENAEYYLGSGAAGDTFFVVFETTGDRSVHIAEVKGNPK